jgi:SpoVK/Ycf46/Vps4 family AAA+-type ATPase
LLELFSKPMRLADDVDLDDITDAIPDASGADIEELCARAARAAFMRCLSSPLDPQVVTAADFDRALGRKTEQGSRECEVGSRES